MPEFSWSSPTHQDTVFGDVVNRQWLGVGQANQCGFCRFSANTVLSATGVVNMHEQANSTNRSGKDTVTGQRPTRQIIPRIFRILYVYIYRPKYEVVDAHRSSLELLDFIPSVGIYNGRRLCPSSGAPNVAWSSRKRIRACISKEDRKRINFCYFALFLRNNACLFQNLVL